MTFREEKFIYWLLAAITTICASLSGVAYHSVDARLTALEVQHDEQVKQQSLILERLATVTANQVIVMRQLEINGGKMDDIYKVVYKAK